MNGVSLDLFIWLALLTFFCEYVDSTLGMGFGTTLTPLLLLMGFEPLQVVPIVLLSEFLTGITSSVLHHEFNNVDLKRGGKPIKCVYVLAGSGVVGVLVAVSLAITVQKWLLNAYIGIMVLSMGIIILVKRKNPSSFSWKKIFGIELISAFNKGLSGGGYGPIVTSGQILSGQVTKNAIGITSLAEGIVCLVGVPAYLFTNTSFDLNLAFPLILGALASTPVAAYTVKKAQAKNLTLIIGLTTTVLGVLTLVKLFTEISSIIYSMLLGLFIIIIALAILKDRKNAFHK